MYTQEFITKNQDVANSIVSSIKFWEETRLCVVVSTAKTYPDSNNIKDTHVSIVVKSSRKADLSFIGGMVRYSWKD